MYYICGVNSMGSTWYLDSKDAESCTVWSGAPKEMRVIYVDKEEAEKKIVELNESHRFGSTRHHLERVVV